MWKNQVEKLCKRCQATSGQRFLEICSSCREYFCRLCATHRHGKRFCSPHCADLFYYGDLEDDEAYE